MDMRTVLTKLSAINSPVIKEGYSEGGEYQKCGICGKQAFVDPPTGFCIDCLDQIEKDQGMAPGSATNAPAKEPITEYAGSSVKDILAHYPEEMEKLRNGELDELSPELYDELYTYYTVTDPVMPYGTMKARTGDPAQWIMNQLEYVLNESVVCETCNSEPCECALQESNREEVIEGVIGAMNNGAITEATASCWGCGLDYKHRWNEEDLATGDVMGSKADEHGLTADDKLCPDCVEELSGGEYLDEGETCESCNCKPCECTVTEARVTDALAMRVKEFANKFFGNDRRYSSARISNGTTYRISYSISPVFLSKFGGTSTMYRYKNWSKVDEADKEALKTLRKKFLHRLSHTDIDSSKVDLKFHMGSGIYASVRVKLEPEGDMSISEDEQVKKSVLQELDLQKSSLTIPEIVSVVWGTMPNKTVWQKVEKFFVGEPSDLGGKYSTDYLTNYFKEKGLNDTEIYEIRDAATKSMEYAIRKGKQYFNIPEKYLYANPESFGVYDMFVNVEPKAQAAIQNFAKKAFEKLLTLKTSSGKLSLSENEKSVRESKQAKEPFAVGMAAAMKKTGDTPPLKKSTIKKAHEIGKSIDQSLDECCDPALPTATAKLDQLNVTTNFSSDTGEKTVTVSAEGSSADELLQMLQMAGVSPTTATEPVATPEVMPSTTVINPVDIMHRLAENIQLNEYLVKGGDSLYDVLSLELFVTLAPEDATPPLGYDYDTGEADPDWVENPEWQEIVEKYTPIAEQLMREIKAQGNRKLTDAEAKKIDKSWYGGFGAINDVGFAIEWLPKYYDMQISAVVSVLKGVDINKDLFENPEELSKWLKENILSEPTTYSADMQLNKLSGGPNEPKAQLNPDRARDNSMTIAMSESSEQIKNRLSKKLHKYIAEGRKRKK